MSFVRFAFEERFADFEAFHGEEALAIADPAQRFAGAGAEEEVVKGLHQIGNGFLASRLAEGFAGRLTDTANRNSAVCVAPSVLAGQMKARLEGVVCKASRGTPSSRPKARAAHGC